MKKCGICPDMIWVSRISKAINIESPVLIVMPASVVGVGTGVGVGVGDG